MTDKQPTNRAILASMERLSKQTVSLSHNLQALSSYGTRSRRLIYLLVASVIFDVVLSVGLGVVGITAKNTADEAKKASNATLLACRAANASNASQRQLWNFVLAFPQPESGSAAEKAEQEKNTASFKRFIEVSFAPKSCKG